MTRRGALIFDMDSLLVNSSPIWTAAEKTFLHAIGGEWSPQLALQYRGMNALDLAATVHRLVQPATSLGQCQQIMRDELVAEYRTGQVTAMPGAVELVRRLGGRAPMAVASGSPMLGIASALAQLSIHDCFDVLISSEDVPRGKPAPDVFIEAARRLGAEAGRCLVFEDSVAGIGAAQAACMACFAVPSGEPERIAQMATRTFGSLADITDDDLAPWLDV